MLGARDGEARGLGDCEKKVPADAERVLAKVSAAFREARANAITESIQPTKDARVYLVLAGLTSGSYTREQATELLGEIYFKGRTIVGVKQAEGCTTGDETMLTRTYLLTTQVGRTTVEGTLTITLVKKKVDEQSSAWFLGSLRDA
jgi:hypothetical protein